MGVLLGNSPGFRGRLRRQTGLGLAGAKENAASAGGAAIIAHFTGPRVPAPGQAN